MWKISTCSRALWRPLLAESPNDAMLRVVSSANSARRGAVRFCSFRPPAASMSSASFLRNDGPSQPTSRQAEILLPQQKQRFTGTVTANPSTRWFSSDANKTTAEEGSDKKEQDTTASEEGGDEGGKPTGEQGTDVPPEEEPKELSREEQLEREIKELKDHLLRSYAEQENTRKIATRDVAAAKQFAIKSFAKSLLDVSDNLSRALDAVPEDMRQGGDGGGDTGAVLKTLYEGIAMTDRGLLKAFEANGLEKYGEVGEPFDPNKHDALFEMPDPSKKPGTVGQVMKAGFMLHNRVLRPAEVGVVKEG